MVSVGYFQISFFLFKKKKKKKKKRPGARFSKVSVI